MAWPWSKKKEEPAPPAAPPAPTPAELALRELERREAELSSDRPQSGRRSISGRVAKWPPEEE